MQSLNWSTHSAPAAGRFETLQHALNESHLGWRLDGRAAQPVDATVQRWDLGDLRLIDYRGGPCSGRRAKEQIARSTTPYFGLLYVRKGREAITDHVGQRVLGAGDLLFWDSSRAQAFSILEPFEKLTLLMPQTAMDALLPRAQDYAGRVLKGPLAALLRASLDALAGLSDELGTEDSRAAADLAVLGLARALAASDRGVAPTAPVRLAGAVLQHIERHLHEDDLGPRSIAAALGISVRYLHLLFAQQGLSVSRWIKRRRLLRCQAQLTGPQRRTITEIALDGGFGDASQFSRAFRAEFGCSPRAWRKRTAAPR